VVRQRSAAGDELVFALHGMHGGQASATVRGIAQRVLLSEVRPGVYEAAYVVRRKDALRGSLVADGHLVINKREATLRYEAEQHGGHGSSQPVVSCGHCGRVTGVNLVMVSPAANGQGENNAEQEAGVPTSTCAWTTARRTV
jgi:hypothetical protein